MSERNEHLRPLRVFRGLLELGSTGLRKTLHAEAIDEAEIRSKIYAQMTTVETPMMSEEELMGQLPLWKEGEL